MAAAPSSCSVVVMSLLLLSGISDAWPTIEYLVGGKPDAWRIPPSSDPLILWAEKSRFVVGDSLVFTYERGNDSVLQVTKKDYETCNTTNPISANNDGNTKILLNRSGPFYFISGAQGHCESGEKLIVVVISEDHWRHHLPSPAPSPASRFEGTAVAPTSGVPSLPASPTTLMMAAFGVLFGVLLM